MAAAAAPPEAPIIPIEVDQLGCWADDLSRSILLDVDQSEFDPDAPSKFPVNEGLNRKIFLCHTDISRIKTDVVVNSSNEKLTERIGVSLRLFEAAGPELDYECGLLDGCRTGEAVATKGCRLPARRVFHTVGPRYNVKYQIAAENALHNCYRNCLTMLKEAELRTISFCCVYTPRKQYPREDAPHIALRTIRRFLERYGEAVDAVVLCVDLPTDLVIYKRVLPLYFPRDAPEECAAKLLLPEYTGNEIGETVVADRNIRIASMPGRGPGAGPGRGPGSGGGSGGGRTRSGTMAAGSGAAAAGAAAAAAGATRRGSTGAASGSSSSESKGAETGSLAQWWPSIFSGGGGGGGGGVTSAKLRVARADAGFMSMQGDIDEQRLARAEQRRAGMTDAERAAEEAARRYRELLDRASEENLADIERLGIMYRSGTDSSGRAIMVFVASHLPAAAVDMDRVLLYLIRELDPVVERDYVIVHLHTNMSRANTPENQWFKTVYNLLPRKYKKNLKQVFLVHPSFWLKLVLWFLTPVLSKKLWRKVHYVEQVAQLYTHFDANQLRLPDYVFRHDRTLNSESYVAADGKTTENTQL